MLSRNLRYTLSACDKEGAKQNADRPRVPEFTQEQYEQTVRKLTGGKSRLETPSEWPVPGLLTHIAGQGRSTFRVVDVWESEEALNRFAEIIVPLLREAGVEGDPEVYPALTYVSA